MQRTGRDAVNMVQIAAGICQTEGRKEITKADIEWVVNSGQYAPRMERRIPSEPAVGLVNGLAVYGPNMGMLINAEAAAIPVEQGRGTIKVTGVMDEEEIRRYRTHHAGPLASTQFGGQRHHCVEVNLGA